MDGLAILVRFAVLQIDRLVTNGAGQRRDRHWFRHKYISVMAEWYETYLNEHLYARKVFIDHCPDWDGNL
jgi:hypothetical protein